MISCISGLVQIWSLGMCSPVATIYINACMMNRYVPCMSD